MSETKQIAAHTPGPWRTDWLNRREGRIVRGDGLVCIAELPLWREEFKEELDANARLIAAAPELLESLEEFVGLANFDADTIPKTPEEWGAMVAKAEAVIQKARGIK